MENQLDKNTLSVPVMFQKINEIITKDTRFTKVKIWLMHTGINVNGSSFNKEAIINAIPSLANTPILGYIEANRAGEEDFSDHRSEMVRVNGKRMFQYKGSAYGVIPETNNAHFETRLCDDGVEREFLVVDGLLWNKLGDAVDILHKTGIKNQSMELADEYKGFMDNDNIFHFTEFKFYGACMLGIDYSPAMVNSTIELDFTNSIKSDIRNKLEEFTKYEKGGLGVENEVKDNVVETEAVLEQPEVEVENATEQPEVEAEASEIPTVEAEVANAETTPVANGEFTAENNEGTEFAEKEEESKEEPKEDEKESKEESKDEAESEDKEEDEEESKEYTKNTEFEAQIAELQTQFEALKAEHEALQAEAVSLREFKEATLKAKREEEEKAIFEKYSALDGVAEYEKIKEVKDTFSTVNELEKEIALVYVNNANKVQTQFTAPAEVANKYYFAENKSEGRYGYLETKYNSK